MAWLADTLEVARQSAMRLLQRRIVLASLPIVLLGALAVGAVGSQAARKGMAGDDFYGVVVYLMLFGFAFPIGVLYLGVTSLHGDIESRSITYLFVRPLHRSSILLGRWLAVVVIAAGAAVASVAAIWLALTVPAIDWPRGLEPPVRMLETFAIAALLGVPAWAAVGVAFGSWFRRPLVAAAVFVMGWELIVSMVPPQAGIRTATIADPLRRWLLQELAPTSGPLHDVLITNLGAFGVDPAALGSPLIGLLRVTVVAVVIALLVFGTREYDSRPRD